MKKIIFLSVLCIGALVYFSTELKMSSSDWAAWFSAGGTILASVVALWLAVQDIRLRLILNIDRAIIFYTERDYSPTYGFALNNTRQGQESVIRLDISNVSRRSTSIENIGFEIGWLWFKQKYFMGVPEVIPYGGNLGNQFSMKNPNLPFELMENRSQHIFLHKELIPKIGLLLLDSCFPKMSILSVRICVLTPGRKVYYHSIGKELRKEIIQDLSILNEARRTQAKQGKL